MLKNGAILKLKMDNRQEEKCIVKNQNSIEVLKSEKDIREYDKLIQI